MTQDATHSLEGREFTADDPVALAKAIDLAFDYRGDVTIARVSTGDPVVGFLFDRTHVRATETPDLRVLLADNTRVSIPIDDVAGIAFTGRDTAAGKSFDTWMKKYVEKKLAGEAANIESEEL
jgi:hypothetical protein